MVIDQILTRNQKVILISLIFISLILVGIKFIPLTTLYLLNGMLIGLVLLLIFLFFNDFSKIYIISNPYQKNKYKSFSEKRIAQYLQRKNIIYKYEHPIHVDQSSNKKYFSNNLSKNYIKPDFYLPEFDVYVEFWGIPDKQQYNNNKKMKKKFYNEEGIDLINLYPDNLVNLDWYFTNRLLHILKKRQGIYRKKSV